MLLLSKEHFNPILDDNRPILYLGSPAVIVILTILIIALLIWKNPNSKKKRFRKQGQKSYSIEASQDSRLKTKD